MKTPKKVEIYFQDHYSLGEDWLEKDHSHSVYILTCLGYLVKEDPLYYYIANTWDPQSKEYQAGTAILKSCVVEYIEYGYRPKKSDRPKQPSRPRLSKPNSNKKKN